MNTVTTLFLITFTTLVAIINPLAVLPVFLKLLQGQDKGAHRRIAWKACCYATLLLFVFLIFGALLLKIFDVPLSMVRIVGGIILMRIGFVLFMPTSDTTSIIPNAPAGPGDTVAFVPLAMPRAHPLKFPAAASRCVSWIGSAPHERQQLPPALKTTARRPAQALVAWSVRAMCLTTCSTTRCHDAAFAIRSLRVSGSFPS